MCSFLGTFVKLQNDYWLRYVTLSLCMEQLDSHCMDFNGNRYLCIFRKSIEKIQLSLTLRLLMSYIYGAPSKARNANVVYIWTYVWQRWNSLFLYAAQIFQHWINAERFPVSHLCVNTLPASWQSVYTQMWHKKPLCIDSVLKHCAANRKRLFQRCQT